MHQCFEVAILNCYIHDFASFSILFSKKRDSPSVRHTFNLSRFENSLVSQEKLEYCTYLNICLVPVIKPFHLFKDLLPEECPLRCCEDSAVGVKRYRPSPPGNELWEEDGVVMGVLRDEELMEARLRSP